MKRVLLIAALAMLGLGAYAQNPTFNNPDNHPYFGVRASVDISAPHSSDPDDMYQNGAGFSIGAIYNVPIIANLYFEPGVSLYYDTWSLNNPLVANIAEKPALAKPEAKTSFRNFGIAIPLMIGYHFDFADNIKASIFTGPEMRCGLVNDFHYTNGDQHESFSVYGKGRMYDKFDVEWAFGGSVSYGPYYFGVKGGVGIFNLYRDGALGNLGIDPEFYQNTVSFSLGYNF